MVKTPVNQWCCRRELNSRPLPYQGSALPLSYGSNDLLLARIELNVTHAMTKS